MVISTAIFREQKYNSISTGTIRLYQLKHGLGGAAWRGEVRSRLCQTNELSRSDNKQYKQPWPAFDTSPFVRSGLERSTVSSAAFRERNSLSL